MSRFRSYREFSQRMAAITTVACPHCGTPLPCSRDEDQEQRMSHYASCTGRPQPVEVIAQPMIIGDIDYAAMTDEQLKGLRLSMELRLKSFQMPLVGVHALLQPAYKSMFEASSAELSRREGECLNG